MLDINYLRENLEEVKKALAKKHTEFDLERLIKLDDEHKDILKRVEILRAEQNKLADKKEKTDRAIEIKRMLKDLEPQLAEAEENLKVELYHAPNIPLEDVPEGENESQNKVLKKVGEVKLQKGKDHIELGLNLDLIDIDRATKISGSRFYFLKNEAVELEFALIRYALDIAKAEGFTPIIPPIIINLDMAWSSGHFEAINDDAYHLKDSNQVLVGTSEQSILPMFAGETLTELPKRYVGFSTCLRREAGSYGKDVKGILRTHQFDKLEMFSFCERDKSKQEHELIISLEEKIMQGLGLPYQKVLLCGGDLGLPSAKTVDIETWLPGEGRYRETHSSSNCTDYQARRAKIRYKNGDKSEFVHTVNGTALAIGRTIIAILENYQSKDGTVKIPKVLRKYCGFNEIRR